MQQAQPTTLGGMQPVAKLESQLNPIRYRPFINAI